MAGAGVASAAGLALAGIATAAPASAKPAASKILDVLASGGVRFHADGHTWTLQVVASSGQDVAVSIGTPYKGGDEVHSWVFKLPAGALTASKTTGHATLNTHSSLAPVASLDLTFTATGHKKESCTSGSGTEFTGNLHGSVTLVTGLHGVKYHSASVTFAKTNSLGVSDNCKAPVDCGGGVWSAGLPTLLASGNTASPFGTLPFSAEVSRSTPLKSPPGAFRTDSAIMKTSKPVFSSSGPSLSVKGSASGIVTGSAVLSSPAVTIPASRSCIDKGKKTTETVTSYLDGSYTSPAGHQFEAHTVLSGTIKVPSTGIGNFVIVTATA